MKKVLIATAVIAALAAPQAFAQANNFTGFSLGINANFATTSSELAASGASVKMGDTSQNASLQGAYGFALGSNGVLGLGLTYGLGDLKAGSASVAIPSIGSANMEIKTKDMYSIYIEPGYAMSNSTLAYAKLAYLGAKGEISASGTTVSENFDGLGYGAGIRTMLDKNLFLQVEFLQSTYNKKTISGVETKPSASTGTIGIGYKF